MPDSKIGTDGLDEEDELLIAEIAQKYAHRSGSNSANQSPGEIRETSEEPGLKEAGVLRDASGAGRAERKADFDTADAKAWRRSLATFFTLGLALLAILLSKDFSPPEILPFVGAELTHLKQFQGVHRDETLWGTYRPGLYFGMRTKEVRTLQTGLMWFDPDRPQALQHIRHQAEDRDGLQKFGWQRHDGRSFGRQELQDSGLQLTTSFAKRFCSNCRGGDWAVRVTADSSQAPVTQDDPERRVSVLFYIASSEGVVDIAGSQDEISIASGVDYPLGGWKLSAVSSGGQLPRARYLGLKTPHVHNLTEVVRREIGNPLSTAGRPGFAINSGLGGLSLPDIVYDDANVALFQYTATLPFSIDFVFTGSLSKQPQPPLRQSAVRTLKKSFRRSQASPPAWPAHQIAEESFPERIKALSGDSLSQLLSEREQEFDSKFDAIFKDVGSDRNPLGTKEVAKAALSNMLGSVGYFYGTSDVLLRGKVRQTKAHPLLASVPSRSFFPRGFLWDEGFHQLLLRRWDPRLSREILAHWLDLLNSQGWMAREQILGEEARSRVPAEFIVQNPKAANPPTLFLPIKEMSEELAAKMDRGKFQSTPTKQEQEQADFLKAAFPRIQAWLNWYLSSQKGPVDGSWRWRGREMDYLRNPFTGELTEYTRELNPKTLTSGLDDYPRSSHPSTEERHVDLYCWMAFASSAVTDIAGPLRIKPHKYGPIMILAEQLSKISLLNSLHYDSSASQYRDWGNHTEHVELRTWYAEMPDIVDGQKVPEYVPRGPQPMGKARFVLQPPQPGFVPHYGYVSLFPLAMRMLPKGSPELLGQLQQLRTGGIMTPFGLRSLSTSSSLHGLRNTEHDPPYWRGPIWMNINYLVLSALKHYSEGDSPTAEQGRILYEELREKLLNSTVQTYQDSNFLWENYDETTGSGRGCRPFTGWSALMVLIASESN